MVHSMAFSMKGDYITHAHAIFYTKMIENTLLFLEKSIIAFIFFFIYFKCHNFFHLECHLLISL